LYHNVFFVKTDMDAVYYIMLVLRQLELGSNTDVSISGRISSDSEFIKHITRNYPNTRFSELNESFSLNETQLQYPVYYYNSLFEQSLCE
jgi:hypothetical protein